MYTILRRYSAEDSWRWIYFRVVTKIDVQDRLNYLSKGEDCYIQVRNKDGEAMVTYQVKNKRLLKVTDENIIKDNTDGTPN